MRLIFLNRNRVLLEKLLLTLHDRLQLISNQVHVSTMTKHLLTILSLLLISCPTAILGQQSLAEQCAAESISIPQTLTLPRWGDAYWRDSVPQSMREAYITHGEKYLGKAWESTPASLFSQFRTTGNRTNYEDWTFSKRNRLAAIAMAEIIEGEGRFLPDIANGVLSLCEETWWGIPAHYGPAVPDPDEQPMDLFSAETGSLAAWILYELEEPLQQFSPNLPKRLRTEIKRRILDEGLNHREWWRGASMNWNTWICSNWLACVLIAETDPERQQQALQEICASLDGFVTGYPDDGGCDEGASYWDRAAGSLLDCASLLSQATNGQVTLADHPKVQAIAEHLCKVNIDNQHFVNFADASPSINVKPQWWPGARAVGNQALSALLESRAEAYISNPVPAFTNDNYAPLGRELMLLSHINAYQQAASHSASALPFDSYLERIQVATARSYPDSQRGLYFAAKGGHNDESHNHNDVGTFIIYADGHPLLVDAGAATYNSKTFTSERYSQWNTRSAFHNLPIINGVEQQAGKEYSASNATAKFTKSRAQFSVDIASAYPAEAKVDKWLRTISLNRGKSVTVTEDYQLAEATGPTQIVLLTEIAPTLSEGKILIPAGESTYALSYDPTQLTAEAEELPIADDQRLSRNWRSLHRILLALKSPKTRNKIKYSIMKNEK